VVQAGALGAGDRRVADSLAMLPVHGFVAALKHLPPARAVRVGASLGRGIAGLGGYATEAARANLELAFPEWSAARRDAVLVESYANLGRTAAEIALLQGPHRAALIDGVELTGLEHVEAAHAHSKSGGFIVLTAHFGSWDLCGAALAAKYGYALTVVQKGFENPGLTRMLSRARGAGSAREGALLEELTKGRSAAAGMLRAIRDGRKVVVLMDQNAHREEGVFVPFFSRLACTRSAPVLIAMKRGVPILPVFPFRKGTSHLHEARALPPLVFEGDADDEVCLTQNVAKMTRVIEGAIRDAPDHWLWAHRRWRTRPRQSDDAADLLPQYSGQPRLMRKLRHRFRRLRGSGA
jgi:KDO2-lipid IV(A) lauroyltransferase